MVLKGRSISVWVEKPTNLVSEKHIPYYHKSVVYSAHSGTQQITPDHRLRVNEGYIAAAPGSAYRICIRIPPHWREIGIQIIIDGIEQGNYIRFNRWKTCETRIGGRRVTDTTKRGFVFSHLRVEDGYGNYKFDESAHSIRGYIPAIIEEGDIEPIEFMVSGKAAGSIRVNVYRVKITDYLGKCTGNGDWVPCTVVDDIGALKMPAGVESVTTLSYPTKCPPAMMLQADFLEKYPFETFVMKYRPHENLAGDNLLIVKRSGFAKLTHYVKKLFGAHDEELIGGYGRKLVRGEKRTFSV